MGVAWTDCTYTTAILAHVFAVAIGGIKASLRVNKDQDWVANHKLVVTRWWLMTSTADITRKLLLTAGAGGLAVVITSALVRDYRPGTANVLCIRFFQFFFLLYSTCPS